MKKCFLIFLSVLGSIFSSVSCSLLQDDSSKLPGSGSGAQLVLSFDRAFFDGLCDDGGDIAARGALDGDYGVVRSVAGLVDTCDFLLTVTASNGTVVYDGKYGDAGTHIDVAAGTYSLRVRSSLFVRPAFNEPLFGDDQTVVVKSGEKVNVRFLCGQLNCGVRLNVSSGFLTSYPSSTLSLSSTGGSLQYSYSERRYAYFLPGSVSLVMTTGGTTKTLLAKRLYGGDMLTIKINCSDSSGGSASSEGGLSIQLDTMRNYISEVVNLGGSGGGSGGGGSTGAGSTKETAYNVSEACDNIGEEDVWVYGYIVGGDLTSSSISFETPFSSATNLAISMRTTVHDKEDCMSVQLPTGAIRDRLNLRDNPGNLHKKIFLKGDIVSTYFGIPGIKNITEYSF